MDKQRTIPVISLQDATATLADNIRKAYASTGFAYLRDHAIPESVIDDLFQASQAFHALPLEQKMQIEINRWHRGFIPINTSTNRTSSVAKTTRPNQSESLMIMHEVQADAESKAYLAGPNQWPSQLPQLKTAAVTYVETLSAVCLKLIVAIEIALAQPAGTLLQHFQSPTTFLRLLRYPVQPKEAGLFGSAPHTDYGFLTLLAQDNTGGLQVKSPDGDWLDIPSIPGCLVLNAGDMLQRFSNGALLSTPHRVINTANCERYSIGFFFDPHVDTIVEPFVNAGETQHYEPVRYGDYLRERLDKNHTQHLSHK